MSTRQSKVTVSIFIFFAVVGTVYSQNLPTAQVLPTTINAGIVTKGSSGSASFTVTNSGGETLSVSNISSSNPQFTVSPTNFSLAANASQTVTVTFSPTVVGWERSTLTIVHNASGSPATVTANGIGRITPPTGSLANTKIAFHSNRDGNYEIYVMNVDSPGTDQARLTNNPSDDFIPSWSPDGTKLAFMSGRDGNEEIYVMNADGTNQTRLTNNPEIDGSPSWSPDGTKIAFVSGRLDSSVKIYVMNVDGTNQTRLTNSGSDFHPSWSPDGMKLAFMSGRDGNLEIYVMNSDGTNPKRLTTNSTVSDERPSWSPDGSKIAFHSGYNGIYVMNADGTNQTRLTNSISPALDGFPFWSPDGTKIAFMSELSSRNGEIYVMNADGTNQTRLTVNHYDDSWPSWSLFLISQSTVQVSTPTVNFGPVTKGSSGTATFTVTNSGGETLSVSNISSSNPQFTVSPTNFSLAANASQTVTLTFRPTVVGWERSTLTISHNGSNGPTTTVTANGIGRITPPAGSLADTKIAFSSHLTPQEGDWEIFVMNADGSNKRRLTHNKFFTDSDPSWSPDGQKIAFVSTRDGGSHIFVMNADGSNQRRVLNVSGARDLSWSPDGSKIAYAYATVGIYVINPDGSNVTRLTEAMDFHPSWSPDGSKIAFSSFRDGNWNIYVMNADGSNQTRLTTNNPFYNASPSWSPDGTKIAFESSNKIYVMNADGSNVTRLSNPPPPPRSTDREVYSDLFPSWSPDGSKIAFTTTRDFNWRPGMTNVRDWEIYVMNADGSNQTRLTESYPFEPVDDTLPSWSPFLIPPPTLPPFQNAIYVWRGGRNGTPIVLAEAQRLADFAVAKGIKTIYYDNYGTGDPNSTDGKGRQENTDLPAIISLLHGKGLQVEALYTGTGTDNARIKDVITYNNKATTPADARFDGIRLNIEAGSFPSGTFPGGGKEPTKDVDIKLYDNAVKTVTQAGVNLPVYVSISHHWDELITYNNVEKAAYKHILDVVAGVDVQTATDNPDEITGIAYRTKDEVCYANSLSKRVDITIETFDVVTYAGLKHFNTFFEEGELVMKQRLATLNYTATPSCPNPHHNGFAYHFYKQSYGSTCLTGWVPDLDRDGILDVVDTQSTTFSTVFSDGTTTGEIAAQGDQILCISDAPDPTKGVLIRALASGGVIPATISVCNSASKLSLNAGDEVIVTCGSVTVDVIRGTVEMTLVPVNGPPATTSLKENNSLTFEPTTFTLTAPATNPDMVIVSVQGSIGGETTTGTVSLSGGNGVTFNPTTFTITAPATNLTPLSVSIDGKNFTLDPGKKESPPVAKAGVDRSLECASPTGTSVKLDGSGSTDPDGDSLSFRWSASGISFDNPASPTPTATFPLGKTIVTLVVNDGKVDSKPDTVEISIVDTTPPTITLAAPISLWPPNSKYVSINLAQCVVSVQDICAGTIPVDKVMITSVSSDEPEDAKGGGDGNTTEDILIAADCKSAQLRSERQGDGNGRVYTIKLSVDDGHGNIGTANCQVTVPHDQGGPPAVDDGPIYTVIGNCNPPAAPSISSNQPVLTLEGKVTVDFASRNFAQRLGSEASNALRFIVVNNRSTGAMLKAPAGLNDNDRPNSMNSWTSWTFRLSVDLTSTPVRAGDVLEVTVQTASPRVGVQPVHYVVSVEDLRASQIYLPNLIVYEIPEKTLLLNNYPNPFNPETWIPYQLAEEAQVTLRIYDITGAVIRSIDVGYKHAAVYESKGRAIHWDGRNDLGERIASGIYFYHLKAGKYQAIRKMVIVK